MEIIIFVHNTKRHSERVKDKMDHRMENTEEQQPEKSDAKDSIMSKIQQLGETSHDHRLAFCFFIKELIQRIAHCLFQRGPFYGRCFRRFSHDRADELSSLYN